MTALKSLLFLILVVGLGAIYIPFGLLPKEPQVETGIFAYLASPLWLLGGVIILWCFWNFTFTGHGTPAPIDPPKQLVTTGLYHFVRNPIYIGALIILIGEFLWFKSIWLLAYAVVVFFFFHLFVTLYEEPTLQAKFGTAYENFRESVPRWIPKIRG
jgi:protein-S-isoprenylcysteine O-methyltransferase Ste14